MEAKYWINDSDNNTGCRHLVVIEDGVVALKDKEKEISADSLISNLSDYQSELLTWSEITKIKTDRDDTSVSIYFRDKDDFQNAKLFSFSTLEELQEFQALIESNHASLFSKETKQKSVKSMVISLVVKLLIVTGLFSFLQGAAAEIAAGAEVVIKGKHRGAKQLFHSILDILGPNGVVVLGVVLTVFIFVSFSKKMKNPNEFVIYSPSDAA